MTRRPALMIAVAAVLGVGAFLFLARASRHMLLITCYFQDGKGLKAGAPVKVAGVAVGSITSVRVRPEVHDDPVEVIMALRTAYELKIPNDSVVVLETPGILGDTFAEIDTSKATGAPLQRGGTLKTRPTEGPSPQQLLDCLTNISQHKPCQKQ